MSGSSNPVEPGNGCCASSRWSGFLAALILGSAVLQSSHGDESFAPITQQPNAALHKEYIAAEQKWAERAILDPLRRNLEGKPWASDALDIAGKTILLRANPKPHASAELIALGKRVIDAGCDDPVVLWMWAYFQYATEDNWRTVFDTYEKAIKRLDKVKYPAAVGRLMAMDFAPVRERGGFGGPGLKGLDQKALAWTKAMLTDGSFAPEEDVILVSQLMDARSSSFIERNSEQLELIFAAAELPEWARKTLIGHNEIQIAWKYRGTKWAHQVTEAGWQGFGEHMARARAALTEAWEANPAQPFAASSMITVAMASAGEEEGDSPRLWFDRATAARFDYYPAYNSLSWALRPRWGGSHEAMLAFADACRETKRWDTDVPKAYLDILGDIASEMGDWRELYRDPATADKVLAVQQGLLDEPTRRGEQHERHAKYAVAAWMCGRHDVAARELAAAHDDLSPAAGILRDNGINETILRSELALLGGKVRENYLRAEQFYHAHENDKALALYDKIAADLGGATPFLIERRRAAIDFEKKFDTGEWVPLVPDLRNWQVQRGNWSAAGGALVVKGADHEALILAPGRVHHDYEIRGHADIVAGKGCCHTFGVVCGYRELEPKKWATLTVYQQGKGGTSGTFFSEFHPDKAAPHPGRKSSAANDFLIQAWDGEVSFYVNGSKILEDYRSGKGSASTMDGQIGLGAHRICASNTVTYRDLAVRKLASAPEHPKPPQPTPKPSPAAAPSAPAN